MVKYGMTIRW